MRLTDLLLKAAEKPVRKNEDVHLHCSVSSLLSHECRPEISQIHEMDEGIMEWWRCLQYEATCIPTSDDIQNGS
jgi:hypothetical protein